ncbi:hypothetical protein PILCRDRAFT_814589 [Piloderma croceum F 1598]|uniref:Uncharacterized protein n=1 Tax=Piloderma croceum (strain F 1598) TaxID=765440 RepID=A0A0C3CDU3_PILCF|nr:hypothetical protein PILCRDRAFT_814589 [Piloderma croceum F 1598]
MDKTRADEFQVDKDGGVAGIISPSMRIYPLNRNHVSIQVHARHLERHRVTLAIYSESAK